MRTYRRERADIEHVCGLVAETSVNHMGFGVGSRSLLADANERILAASSLFRQAVDRYRSPAHASDPLVVDWTRVFAWTPRRSTLLYAFFPWASFANTKAAVKMHTLLTCTAYPHVYPHYQGKSHDVNNPGRDLRRPRVLCHDRV